MNNNNTYILLIILYITNNYTYALGHDAIFRMPISGIIMWTQNKEYRDSFAAISQPSSVSSY